MICGSDCVDVERAKDHSVGAGEQKAHVPERPDTSAVGSAHPCRIYVERSIKKQIGFSNINGLA